MTRSSKHESVADLSKVFVVEDHPVFREGLVQVLNGESDLEVCGESGSAEQALPALKRLRPDIVLVDVSLPGKSGLELIREVRLVNRRVKILVISMCDEAVYAARVLQAGGDGYIMKQEDPEEIVRAIRDVLHGHIYVSEEVATSVEGASRPAEARPSTGPLDHLTDSELEILELLGRGKTDREIARQLDLDNGTVAAHRQQIKQKLKLKSANALIRYAVCWVETGAVG